MKPVTFIGFLFLLSFKTSSTFEVKRLANSTSTTEKDLRFPTPNYTEISQDDPALQRALQMVLRQMNSKLNKTTGNANDGDDAVTKKLKLFFVTPSGISEEYEEIEDLDYSDSRYNIESGKVSALVTDQKERTSYKDHVNASIAAKSVHSNGGMRLETPPLKRVASTYFGGVKSSNSYETDGFKANHTYGRIGNETSEVFQKENQATKNDNMEMKVELTINLSENDHVHSSNSDDSAELKNLSYESENVHLTDKADDVEKLVHTSHQVSDGNSPILNLAAGNLNLNIKLMSHNHTDSNVKFENDNESKSDILEKRHELSDTNLRNLSNSRRSEISDNIQLFPSHSIHGGKSNAEQYEKLDEHKFEPANHSNLSSREVKFMGLPLAKREELASDWTQTVVTTETYSPMAESSSSQATEIRGDQNLPRTSFSLSDSLKKEIENISHHFNGEDDNSLEGVTRIRNLNKFLPQRGGNPEEQKKIEQLHKYFSQSDFLDKIGIRNTDSQTDFEVFIEVLRKLKQSKIIQGSSFYPIILYYLKLNQSFLSGIRSGDGSDSSDESWYSESFISSLADYLFDDDDQDLIRNSVKAKLNFLENEFEEDSDLNSGEYEYTLLK